MIRKLRPFIDRAIENWLEGYSVIPMRPHIARLYPGFDVSPYEKRQPTLQEMHNWEDEYPNAGVGIVVNYKPDREKTLNQIKKMDLMKIMDVPAFILFRLQDEADKGK